jgi:hypothetical protein
MADIIFLLLLANCTAPAPTPKPHGDGIQALWMSSSNKYYTISDKNFSFRSESVGKSVHRSPSKMKNPPKINMRGGCITQSDHDGPWQVSNHRARTHSVATMETHTITPGVPWGGVGGRDGQEKLIAHVEILMCQRINLGRNWA